VFARRIVVIAALVRERGYLTAAELCREKREMREEKVK
jgi:hypothetical protein